MSAEITDGLGDFLPIIIALLVIAGVVFSAFNYVAKKTKDATAFRITTEHNYEKLDTKIDVQKEEVDKRFSTLEEQLSAAQLQAQSYNRELKDIMITTQKETVNAINKLGEALTKK